MAFLWFLLIFQLEFIVVKNYIVNNDVYEDNAVLSVAEDGTYNIQENHNEQDIYNLKEFPIDNEFEEKSRMLDFEEKHVKPIRKQNMRLYKNYKNEKKKRDLNAESNDEYTFRYQTSNVTEEAYDYDKFKQEYDHDVQQLNKFQAQLNQANFELSAKSQCVSFLNKGPMTMLCLFRELNYGETEEIKEKAKQSIKELLKLWGIIFLVLFLVGWGHYGYCNWICPTKYCFPEDCYEEMKQKLAMNPPGTMINKIEPKKDENSKPKFEKEYYEPSETEYYLHNSLWKDIYHV